MTGPPNSCRVPDRVAALLDETAPFSLLAPGLREQAIADLLVEYFDPDEQILAQGRREHEFLYIVESGSVRLVDNENHRLVDLCGEGDAFGAEGLLAGQALPYEAVAAEPTVCALLPAARFHALCQADEQFAGFFAGRPQPPKREAEPSPDRAGAHLLFGTRVKALARRHPPTCSRDATAREAAQRMRSDRLDAILVVEGGRGVGIVTDTDLRNKVVAEGAPVDTPVARLMSSPVVTVGADSLVFDALMVMSRRRIHHLVVTAEGSPDSELVGILSDQDIAHANGQNPAATVKRIEKARSIPELARIRTEADGHLMRLHRQGVPPAALVEVIAEVNDRLTVRLLQLAEADLRAQRLGDAVELRWAWVALGSKARREMGVRGDQDNAIIYEDPTSPAQQGRADAWFKAIAQRVNMGLGECGFALCKGWVMASNDKWRQPLSSWKRIFRNWILDPEPKALMHASIFFDLRGVYGDDGLVEELKADLCDALDRERAFLTFLTHNALSNKPPLSFFRRFVVDHSGEYQNTLDLKLHGLMPVVDMARILALESRFVGSVNTLNRLQAAGERLPDAASLTANAADAYRYLLDLRLEHHLAMLEAGQRPNDHIAPGALSKTQQQILRAVFSTVQDMQERLAFRYGAHMMGR